MLYSRNKVSKSIYSTYVKSLRRCFKFIILRALPFGYSAALSGRCRGGVDSVTQGGALGYVLLPLRGADIEGMGSRLAERCPSVFC